MKIHEFNMNSHMREGLDSPQVLEKLAANGFRFDYRLDAFQDEQYQYFGFNAKRVEAQKLTEIEGAIEVYLEEIGDFKIAHMDLPLVVGTVPYEMAADFMKISFDVMPMGHVFLSHIVLCISKKTDEAYLVLVDKITDEAFHDEITSPFLNLLKDSTDFLIQSDLKKAKEIFSHQSASSVIKHSERSVDLAGKGILQSTYREKIKAVLENIEAGEIFQMVLAEKMELPYSGKAISYYLQGVKETEPAYAAFLEVEGGLSVTSPELLVRYDSETVITKPIAGTRGIKCDGRDFERIEELQRDEKEAAEHLMLVDLGRNDLSKVCKAGTVEVTRYKYPLILKHVAHLVSDVEGKRAFKRFFDPLRAVFPAGTVSGAPKLRAMELIKDIEARQRGIYGGAVYVYSSRGRFESCIAIRCATFDEKSVILQVGSGIVHDSNAEDELKELMNKIRGNLKTYERMEADVSFD